MVLDGLPPSLLNILEGRAIGSVVNNGKSMRPFVVRSGDGIIFLVSCCIPDLHFDIASIDIDILGAKLNAYCLFISMLLRQYYLEKLQSTYLERMHDLPTF